MAPTNNSSMLPAELNIIHELSSNASTDTIETTQSSNGFEGPEKILEVDFLPIDTSNNNQPSLRQLPQTIWDKVLSVAKCEIISKCSNEKQDAYVLSESSLFVYDLKAYIKTCGTTTLLLCLQSLLKAANSIGLKAEWVGYSRKNFLFPQHQLFPHTSFKEEVEFARSYGKLHQTLPGFGAAFVLGDLTSDHCYVYVADFCERSEATALDKNINIMMYGLDPSVSKVFFKNKGAELQGESVRAREESGLASMKALEGCIFDDTMFDPCGYSLNALRGDAFYTVHITPEHQCCYASFETNEDLSSQEYMEMLEEVMQVFKPQKFTLTMFADRGGLKKIDQSPAEFEKVVSDYENGGTKAQFVRTSMSSSCIATDYVCQLANFVRK